MFLERRNIFLVLLASLHCLFSSYLFSFKETNVSCNIQWPVKRFQKGFLRLLSQLRYTTT
ncbi:hypothetical protein BD408DRAFT_418683 [Parasitella parasitica]|nr:hypothetical protein BD408DRAFT_418683 [Parasitella parasitica]